MDWITHAAVGAAVGELLLAKRMGNQALAWGALFGIAPDLLDGLASWFLSYSGELAYLYGPSHSLLLGAVLSLVLPRQLVKRWKRNKVPLQQATWFVGLVWITHLGVDCLSLPGVQLLWPYPAPRVGFNLLATGDVLFPAPLVIALVGLAFLRTKKQQPKRRRLWWWGTGLSGGYLALALSAKWAASAGFEADLIRRGTVYDRRSESPSPSNILLWRGMIDRGDEIWVAYRTIFEWHSTPVRWTVFPRGREALAKFADSRDVRRVTEYAQGWWIARPNKTGIWLADVRFGENRLWGERKGMVDNRFKRSWHLEPESPGDPLHPITAKKAQPGDSTRRLLQRTLGKREAWDAYPRLAGVPGALTEMLTVEE